MVNCQLNKSSNVNRKLSIVIIYDAINNLQETFL